MAESLSLISVLALNGGGGGATGIRVGYVNQDSTTFPTTRPDGSPLQKEDYVSVDVSAELPFTIGTITFNTKRDTAVWTGEQWVLSAGAVIESNEIFLKQKTTESLSGTQTIQSATNIEFANAIGKNVNLSVDGKTNLIEALNYVWIECKKAGYTFTISNTDNDSIRSIVFNVKDKDNNVLINKTLDDFILRTRKVAGYDLVDDITAQEIQDAIKDLTVTLTNKTMSADDNTFTDFETDNFKNSALAKSTDNVRDYLTSVDTKLTTEKFIQKTLQNIATPQNSTDAVNKDYVDNLVEGLSGKVMKFKGFISSTQPTGNIDNGALWYESVTNPTTFPINVKTYDATTSEWSSTTTEYTPSQLDLFSNLNDGKGYYWFGNNWNLIDENVSVDDVIIMKNNQGQLTFKVKTSADQFKSWVLQSDGTWALELITKWEVVSTFIGITFDTRTLYILTQDTTLDGVDYAKGMYFYDGSNIQAVEWNEYQKKTDNNLNTTDKTIVGAINEVNNKFVAKSNGIITTDLMPSASASNVGYTYFYTGATTTTFTTKSFYQCVETLPSTTPKTYHYEEYKVAGEVFEDTDNLSYITNPSKQVIYRVASGTGNYKLNGADFNISEEHNLKAYKILDATQVQVSTTGITISGVSYSYGVMSTALQNALVNASMAGYISYVSAYDSPNTFNTWFNNGEIDFVVTEIDYENTDVYYRDSLTLDALNYNLYHNPTETPGAANFIKIGGNLDNYYNKTEIDTKLDNKQDVLTIIQLAAANSGIDTTKVAQIETNKNEITTLQTNKVDTAGTGLTKNGTTLNHSNSITSQTTSKIGAITFDAQGHITGFTEKHIYMHSMGIKYSNVANYYGTFNIFNESDSPMDASGLATYLYSNGYNSAETQYPISGSDDFVNRYCATTSGGSATKGFTATGIMTGIYSTDGTSLNYLYERVNTRTLSMGTGSGTWITEINCIKIL